MMYLVRMIENKNLVGVYAAPNLYDLSVLIDEIVDPSECEYQEINFGGILLDGMPVPDKECDNPEINKPTPLTYNIKCTGTSDNLSGFIDDAANEVNDKNWQVIPYCPVCQRFAKIQD